jgi:hypothetical protein
MCLIAKARIFGVRMRNMKNLPVMTLLLCIFLFHSRCWAEDSRLMNEPDYRAFLAQVEAKLPVWEAALKRIDPAKTTASYVVGKQIVQYRDLALMEVGYVRQWIPKQRLQHTVSGELALEGFLRSIFDAMDSVVSTESIAGITASNLEDFAAESGDLIKRIANDVTARVELLEKETCP